MEQAAAFLEQLRKLHDVVGTWGIVAYGLVFVVAPLVYMWRRDLQLERAYRETVDTKEEEVQRVVGENREWREMFFRDRAESQEILSQLLERGPPAQPINSKQQRGASIKPGSISGTKKPGSR